MAVVMEFALEIGGQHGFHGIDSLESGEAGREYGAGLVAGVADGGFVLGEDGAGNDGGQHLALGLTLREHLVADAGVLHVEGNHFAQAEAHHGDGFGGFAGQGIEVEDEDADEGVGQDQSDGVGARRNLGERGTNGRCDGFGRAQVGLFDAGDQRAGGQRHKGVDWAASARSVRGRSAAASTPSGEISTAAGGRPPAALRLVLCKIDGKCGCSFQFTRQQSRFLRG